MAFSILTRFILVKYSHAFVERPLQGTSSLASRLTTVSLDINLPCGAVTVLMVITCVLIYVIGYCIMLIHYWNAVHVSYIISVSIHLNLLYTHAVVWLVHLICCTYMFMQV